MLQSLFLFGSISFSYAQIDSLVEKEKLIQDTRQLLSIIESSHPDPYINGGGKIAFHRRFQDILLSIAEEGLTVKEYYKLLLPFLSSIGDGHTGLMPLSQEKNEPGIPFTFKVVEKNLILKSVPAKEYKELLGSKLISLQDIPINKIYERQQLLRGAENEYTVIALLIYSSFRSKGALKRLIPEWESSEPLHFVFEKENKTLESMKIPIPFQVSDNVSLHSKIDMPQSSSSDINFGFTDNKNTAILTITDMSAYREGIEDLNASGYNGVNELAINAYKKFHTSEVPEQLKEIIDKIPSATETFIELLTLMKKSNTKNLIIDLRNNTGGNSIMREILIYFLFGKDALYGLDNGYSISKYSPLFFNTYESVKLQDINKDLSLELNQNDYNFISERGYLSNINNIDGLDEAYEKWLKKIPTFYKVYSSGRYDSPMIPLDNILVISNPFTYSSGFNLLTALYENGAKIIGTPSGQSANNFGDALLYNLDNTGIRGFVSYKQVLTYPKNFEKGKCFMPDYILTIDKFRQYNSDPNAEILYSLDLLSKEEFKQ